MLINNCPGIPNGGLSCDISRGGSRKASKSRNYKGGNFTCPYPVSERVSDILGPLACNISRGGSLKHAIRDPKDYYKCGPMPWSIHTKCPSGMKCHKKVGHPAGIGHARGSHTCY